MKSSLKFIIAVAISVTFLSIGCSSSSEKVTKAEDNVVEANKKLDEEKAAYQQDMKEFKIRSAEQIAANEKSIEEFNARIATQKMEAKAEYQKKIDELNTKNSDLKKKIADFNTDSKSSWELFKSEFSRDMDELGTAFKDFTVTNEK